MSTSLSSIPERATVTHHATATRPDGQRAAFSVHRDRRSHGYQTDYAPVEVAWYAIDAPGILRRCWQYSGRRYVRAEQDYRTAIAEAIGAGWTVTQLIGTVEA